MTDVGMAYKLAQIRRNRPKVTKIFMKAAKHPSKDPAEWSEIDEKGTDEVILDTKKIKELLSYLTNNSYVKIAALKKVTRLSVAFQLVQMQHMISQAFICCTTRWGIQCTIFQNGRVLMKGKSVFFLVFVVTSTIASLRS